MNEGTAPERIDIGGNAPEEMPSFATFVRRLERHETSITSIEGTRASKLPRFCTWLPLKYG